MLIQEDPLAAAHRDRGRRSRTAPIRVGVASKVMAQPGDVVEKNAPLVVIEAMKMELTLRAPRGGNRQGCTVT